MVHGGGVIPYMGCSGVYIPKMYGFLPFCHKWVLFLQYNVHLGAVCFV